MEKKTVKKKRERERNSFIHIIIFIYYTVFISYYMILLQLPLMSDSTSIVKDVCALLKLKPIVIFLCFATLAGILDSFMIYFLFW